MPFPLGYQCSSCDEKFEVTTGLDRFYVLPDRYELLRADEPGWCDDCDSLVQVERIDSLESIERRLANAIEAADDARTLERQTRELEWRKSRQSPPRCLHCHSTAVQVLDKVVGARHPGCQGVFEPAWGSCIHYITDYRQYLTPEGRSFEADCLQRVALFVSEFAHVPISRLASGTRLDTDLRITGARAIQLMTAYGQEFRVDLSRFQYLDHFHSPDRSQGLAVPNEISLRRLARALHSGLWK